MVDGHEIPGVRSKAGGSGKNCRNLWAVVGKGVSNWWNGIWNGTVNVHSFS